MEHASLRARAVFARPWGCAGYRQGWGPRAKGLPRPPPLISVCSVFKLKINMLV